MECWSTGFSDSITPVGVVNSYATTAVGKNVDFPPERLVDYSLLKEVQKELGIQ